MSSQQRALIDAIRRIAKSDPEIRSILETLNPRGALPSVGITANIDDYQDECCSKDKGGNDLPGGPCETTTDNIWCNPEDPWNDCSTGKPVEFYPGGFPQPENCKECEPDDDWQQGVYWYAADDNSIRGPTPSSIITPALNKRAEIINSQADFRNVTLSFISLEVGTASAEVRYLANGERKDGSNWKPWSAESSLNLRPTSCGASTADYCTITEPPVVCGPEWADDGTKELALINGCIVGSKCDPNATGADQHCNKCKDLCRDGETKRICATSDGGFVVYYPDGSKDGEKYDSNGKRTDTIPAGSGAGSYM